MAAKGGVGGSVSNAEGAFLWRHSLRKRLRERDRESAVPEGELHPQEVLIAVVVVVVLPLGFRCRVVIVAAGRRASFVAPPLSFGLVQEAHQIFVALLLIGTTTREVREFILTKVQAKEEIRFAFSLLFRQSEAFFLLSGRSEGREGVLSS